MFTTLLAISLAIASSVFVLIIALHLDLAGRILADVFIGLVISIFLLIAFPPPPDTPEWLRLIVWIAAGLLSHYIARLKSTGGQVASPPNNRAALGLDIETLEKYFEVEEVISWDD